jgi:hypothetical protein
MIPRDTNNKRVKMNPYKLTTVDALKRSFFKEAISVGWTFGMKSIIFNLCKHKSYDFEDILSILKPFIDQTNSEYSEPAPIKSKVWEIDMDFMSNDFEFYSYQFSLTERFSNANKLITDDDDIIN